MTCPNCGQVLHGVEWKYVRKRPDGKWEASVREGKFVGWAMQDTEELVREKAMARLNYYKTYGQ